MTGFKLLSALRARILQDCAAAAIRMGRPRGKIVERRMMRSRPAAPRPLALRRRYHSWHLPRRNQIGR